MPVPPILPTTAAASAIRRAARERRRRRSRAIPLVVVAVMLAACTGGDDGPITGVVPDDEPLPVIEGPTLGGPHASTADLRGRPAVVNVWATWCAPCQAELPALVDVASAYEGQVAFLGVNYGDSSAQARVWEDDYAIPYPSIEDPSGAFADDLGFPYLPHTLVVDAAGTIRYRIYGETTSDDLSALLDGLLAEEPVAAA
ncbi:MAG TPA: TlpA disulfide reductase family protein [Actinomycetota bacterium]|nr:TlpA disulfide reductase family protein [Actinomycetota bacterium]